MGLAKVYPYTKFEVSSVTSSRFTEGGLIFGPWTLTTPFLGVFCHASGGTCQDLSMYTKFEVSIFTRSKDTA